MPKITDMIDTMANAASLAVSPAIGISGTLENVGNLATSLAKPFNTYDTEVDLRPAAQQ